MRRNYYKFSSLLGLGAKELRLDIALDFWGILHNMEVMKPP